MKQLTHRSKATNAAASFLGALILFIFAAVLPASATTNITLAWTPSSNPSVTGFIIYFGPASRAYTNSLTVGNVTNVTINGLVNGATYYFAATTYNVSGAQSKFSDEVVFAIPTLPVTPPPTIVTNEPPIVPTPPPVVPPAPPVIPPTSPIVPTTPPVIPPTPPPVIINPLPTSPVTPPVVPDPTVQPTLDPIADISIRSSSALRSVVLSGLSSGNITGHIVSVTATSSQTDLVGNPSIRLGSSGNAGIMIFKTATNTVGSAVITVTVTSDNADNNTFSRSFTVNLLPAGNITSNLRPPAFFHKPTNTVAFVGKTVALKASASGIGLLKYSWTFNGRAIHSAHSATLTLPNVSTSDAGVYSVTVTSTTGVTNSRAALTVYESPAATLGTATRAANDHFRFPVTGIPGYKYVVQSSSNLQQWTSIATNTSPFVFEDKTAATQGQRFFRAYYDPEL